MARCGRCVRFANRSSVGKAVTSKREPTLAMPIVRRIVEAVEHAGVPRGELLAAAGIDAVQLEDAEARLPSSQLHCIFDLAIELTGDPALGLHWLEGAHESGFAPLGQLVAHAANLRHAFESLASFSRLLMDGPLFQLLEQGDKVTVRCSSVSRAPPRIRRFAAEMVVTSLFLMLRFFSARARPEQVCFEYAAPRYRGEYMRLFGRAVCFEQPFNGLVFDRALLDVPSPYRDESVHAALRVLAERRITRLGQRRPFAQRVHELLVQQGCPCQTDMQSVARSLGLSVRSLRRRLAAEGESYKAVANDALASLAKHLLRDEQRTIQEAAYEMGFADATSFHRAFKRWTGTTPTAYRESA